MEQSLQLESEVTPKLIYTAYPSRFLKGTDTPSIENIMQFIAEQGHGALHPFNALPYEYFEGGILGRKRSMEMCFRLITICDEFWVMGISEGVFLELAYVLQWNKEAKQQGKGPKPIRSFVDQFDPEWQQYLAQYAAQFPEASIALLSIMQKAS